MGEGQILHQPTEFPLGPAGRFHGAEVVASGAGVAQAGVRHLCALDCAKRSAIDQLLKLQESQ